MGGCCGAKWKGPLPRPQGFEFSTCLTFDIAGRLGDKQPAADPKSSGRQDAIIHGVGCGRREREVRYRVPCTVVGDKTTFRG